MSFFNFSRNVNINLCGGYAPSMPFYNTPGSVFGRLCGAIFAMSVFRGLFGQNNGGGYYYQQQSANPYLVNGTGIDYSGYQPSFMYNDVNTAGLNYAYGGNTILNQSPTLGPTLSTLLPSGTNSYNYAPAGGYLNSISVSGGNTSYGSFLNGITVSGGSQIGDSFYRTTNYDYSNYSAPSTYATYRNDLVNKACSYKYIKSDHQGVKTFSPAGVSDSWGWCADFVVGVGKEVMGNKFPSKLKTSSAKTFKENAIALGCYTSFPSALPKPGDVIVMKGSGPSGHHVAYVKEVKNGKITLIGGNSSNSVKETTYSLSDPKLYGVVNLDKFMA